MKGGAHHDVVVIGAGPAGLGAALALGDTAVVLEHGPDAGGLCATVALGGAVFDLGGHSFHTPHPTIRELVFGAVAMEEQAREAWCVVGGEWIPYPFQKNFGKLRDRTIVRECREGLERRSTVAPRNLDEHLEGRYGAGITRHFLRPYNEKLWGPDLTRLTTEWTAQRMAASTDAPEAFSTEGGVRTPLQSDTRVAYPARGGYGEIFRSLAKRVPRIRFGASVASIDTRLRSLATARGERLHWKRIVSTLPLPVLLDLLPDVPAPLRGAVRRLVALPVTLVLIALESRLETPIQRIYFPGNEFPGHKVVVNHNSSASLRALPNHGVLVEVSAGGGRASNAELLCKEVIAGLRSVRLLRDRDKVAATRVIELSRAYPVPTHERAAIVDDARTWLAERGISSVGRFGEWAYINADEALYRGLRLGEKLVRQA
ncbi:MAG TPA: FAD-dependent oxidoreductase [Usitatibacter sp.]|nr:FAD-dependent oxidoreductase [Usitatibacter sp.]